MARVGVIDDDDDMREMVQDMLEDDGHEVITAADGAAGIPAVREHGPDIVITGIIMPGKDGITTPGEIHQEFPSVAILADSGGNPRAPQSDLPLAKIYGGAATLDKPFEQHELVAEIRSLMLKYRIYN